MLNFIKNLVKDIKVNFKYIIVSFIVSLITWFAISIQVFPTIETNISGVKVEVQPTDYMIQNNLQIVSDYEKEVNIRIEGKRFDISGLTADDFYASLNLSSIKSAGRFSVPVNVYNKVDSNYNLIESNPLAVTLEIDEIVSRDFDIAASAPDITLPEGYYADEVTASPATVTITGSAAVLNNITKVEARSVFSGEIIESHETKSEIIIYGQNGARLINDEVSLSTENISVYIPIYKQKELPLTFSLINLPDNFDKDSLKYEIFPKSITVAAPDDSIDFLSELDIGTINISDIKLNQTVTIPIALPEGYKNLSGNNSARINWDISDYSKMDFTVENISIRNPPDNYDVSLITKQLQVTIIGPSEKLSALSASDIYITANLLGVSLHGGSQVVAVNVRIAGTAQQCWATGSYTVTISAQEPPSE